MFVDWEIWGLRKEKYYYTRHEIFALGFFVKICYFSLLCLYLFVWAPSMIARGDIVKLLLPLLFFLTNPLATWSNTYLYAAVTGSTISLKGQLVCRYGFYSRQISYHEIAGIIFKCNSKFAYREKFFAFKCRIFGNGPKESQFVIKFNNNDYVIVRSGHTKEMLAAIKKACPSINIY